MEKIKYDILGVTEVRVNDQGSYILPSGAVLFHSGAITAHHGIAFLVRQSLANDVRFTPLSNRLATLRHFSLKVYLVLCYAPASSNDNHDEYDYYLEEVERICRRIPKGHTPILPRDLNAKLGREPGNETFIGKYTSSSQNDCGRLLTELLTRLEYRAWNTFFRKRKGQIWTCRSPNGTVRNHIDFICSPPSTTVLDCGVVGKFPFNSDHRMVRMQLVARQSSHRNFVRPSHLLTRIHLDRELYKVHATLLSSEHHPQPKNALESYDSIRVSVETAAKDCWTTSSDPPRVTPRTRLLLYERITLRNDPSPEGRIAYSIACKAARIGLLEDTRRRKIAVVQKTIEKGRSLNEALRKGNHKVRRLMIKDRTTGEYSQQATEAMVTSYYNELFSTSIDFSFTVPPSVESCPPFCIDEAEHALSQLRLGRCPGPDGISAEQLALAKSSVAHFLTVLLNSIKRGDPIPGSLTTAHVKLLFKKGDPNNINNFRPITLISGVLKAVTRAVLNRIEGKLEESESPSQVGFRREHSTLNLIHVLKRIAKKSKENNFPVYVALD
ncbi:hypothetical protein ANCCEY_06284 [Ancylostoma ceylanicum]|nr:hypothetical protein ANCCEY_06284 [Ancylostoma ceylanicum]